MRNLLLWIASIALIAFQVPYANATTFYGIAYCASGCGAPFIFDTTYEGNGEYLVNSITSPGLTVIVLAPGTVENPLSSSPPPNGYGFPVYNDNILYYPDTTVTSWDFHGLSFAIGGTDFNIACYPAPYNCGITNLTAPASFQSFTGGSLTETPLPAALPLLATGIGAMGLLGWRRKRKNAAAIAVA